MESGALRGCLDPPLATDERRRGKLGDLGEARGVAVARRAMGMDEQYGVGADRAMDDHRIDPALRRHPVVRMARLYRPFEPARMGAGPNRVVWTHPADQIVQRAFTNGRASREEKRCQ